MTSMKDLSTSLAMQDIHTLNNTGHYGSCPNLLARVALGVAKLSMCQTSRTPARPLMILEEGVLDGSVTCCYTSG
uniref:Uncharacterized protein n=1 Tax=Hyaloperonospora arabidopsidis (strain Emoy2) TaxID=559515 RepID=M4BKC2_HYAAE